MFHFRPQRKWDELNTFTEYLNYYYLIFSVPLLMSSFTELVARTNAGEEVKFSGFEGKVVLIVNVARL